MSAPFSSLHDEPPPSKGGGGRRRSRDASSSRDRDESVPGAERKMRRVSDGRGDSGRVETASTSHSEHAAAAVPQHNLGGTSMQMPRPSDVFLPPSPVLSRRLRSRSVRRSGDQVAGDPGDASSSSTRVCNLSDLRQGAVVAHDGVDFSSARPSPSSHGASSHRPFSRAFSIDKVSISGSLHVSLSGDSAGQQRFAQVETPPCGDTAFEAHATLVACPAPRRRTNVSHSHLRPAALRAHRMPSTLGF